MRSRSLRKKSEEKLFFDDDDKSHKKNVEELGVAVQLVGHGVTIGEDCSGGGVVAVVESSNYERGGQGYGVMREVWRERERERGWGGANRQTNMFRVECQTGNGR